MNKAMWVLGIFIALNASAAPSIHSNGQLTGAIHQFIEDYKLSGASLYEEQEKQKKKQARKNEEIDFNKELEALFEKEIKQSVPAETITNKITELENGGSILKHKYKALFEDLDLREPHTYNQIVAELITRYYNDPASRDAVFILVQHLSDELKTLRNTGKLREEDSVSQSILNWTMFASALIVIRDAVRERGGFVDIWNKYFRKAPEGKMITHHSNGAINKPLEEYSAPMSTHRQKCQNWTYGKKTAEELMQLRRILSRGKAVWLGSLDSLCVSARIGTEATVKGGLVAGGAYAFADWEENKYDPAELLKPFIYFSIHNLMVETHQLYEKIHGLFEQSVQSDRVIDASELKQLANQVAEIKKQERHFSVVAPELVLGKINQPELYKGLNDYRARWKASIVLQGIPVHERISQLLDQSTRLQKQVEQYYESVDEAHPMISIAPIQIQRDIMESELKFLIANPK
jgi:hypothetical protein